MRTLARCVLLVSLISMLGVSLASPAVAGQRITYRGMTSQDKRVSIEVIERDSGRRILWDFRAHFTLTCEDATTRRYGIGWRFIERLGEDGSFEVHDRVVELIYAFSLTVDGIIRWGSAEGTFEFRSASLTDDDQAQLCTTGAVDWTAHRDSTQALSMRSPDNTTLLDVGRDGQLQVIEPEAARTRRPFIVARG